MPFNPHRFLYAMWKHSSDLAGYEQQYAHEFFISLLDGLHLAEAGRAGGVAGTDACACIVHRVFSGVLRSDVVCQACRNVSTCTSLRGRRRRTRAEGRVLTGHASAGSRVHG